MPRLKGPEQLAAYRAQQVELAKKIKAAEDRRRKRARQEEERRRQILGAAVLAYFAQPDQLRHRATFLEAMFEAHPPSAADRLLFAELMTPAAEPLREAVD